MKLFFICIFCFFFNKEPIKELITVCKDKKSIRIDYVSPVYGIYSLQQTTKNDTLEIKFKISFFASAKPKELLIPNNVKYLLITNKVLEIQKLPLCADLTKFRTIPADS